jgi:hypothetical protein
MQHLVYNSPVKRYGNKIQHSWLIVDKISNVQAPVTDQVYGSSEVGDEHMKLDLVGVRLVQFMHTRLKQ